MCLCRKESFTDMKITAELLLSPNKKATKVVSKVYPKYRDSRLKILGKTCVANCNHGVLLIKTVNLVRHSSATQIARLLTNLTCILKEKTRVSTKICKSAHKFQEARVTIPPLRSCRHRYKLSSKEGIRSTELCRRE